MTSHSQQVGLICVWDSPAVRKRSYMTVIGDRFSPSPACYKHMKRPIEDRVKHIERFPPLDQRPNPQFLGLGDHAFDII